MFDIHQNSELEDGFKASWLPAGQWTRRTFKALWEGLSACSWHSLRIANLHGSPQRPMEQSWTTRMGVCYSRLGSRYTRSGDFHKTLALEQPHGLFCNPQSPINSCNWWRLVQNSVKSYRYSATALPDLARFAQAWLGKVLKSWVEVIDLGP